MSRQQILGLLPARLSGGASILFFLLVTAHLPVIYLTPPITVALTFLYILARRHTHMPRGVFIHLWIWIAFILYLTAVSIFNPTGFGNLFWSYFFLLNFCLIPVLMSVKTIGKKDIHLALEWFILVQMMTVGMQILFQFVSNPGDFLNGGGDGVTGTATSLSSILSVTMMTISCIYIAEMVHERDFPRRRQFFLGASILLAFLPGYMSGFMLFLLLVGTYLFFFEILWPLRNLKFSPLGIGVFLGMIVACSVIAGLFWSYFDYVYQLTADIIVATRPLKMITYENEISCILISPEKSIIGAGLGAGNSRAAFLVSGDPLVPNLPFTQMSMSAYYRENIYPIMELRHSMTWFGKIHSASILNTVYSQLLAFLSEGGILGLLILIAAKIQLFMGSTKRTWSRNAYLPLACLVIMGVIDFWGTFPSGQIMYWTIVFYWASPRTDIV